MITPNATGYFGRAGGSDGRAMATKVHYVKPNGKVACGYKPHKTLSFMFCANGVHWPYITCKTCKGEVSGVEKIKKESEKAMSESTINIGKKVVEKDVVIVLPNKEVVRIQYRRYDDDGPSLDILLPEPMPVNNFIGSEMKPAKALSKGKQHIRQADQITLVF